VKACHDLSRHAVNLVVVKAAGRAQRKLGAPSLAVGLLALAVASLAVSGCRNGPSARPNATFEPVHFPAADGVILDGRLFDSGRIGIVLVHMGRSGDTQVDWVGLAQILSRHGYTVLTYNRRGVCPGDNAGCSKGNDAYELSWKDVVGAVRFLRDKGTTKTVVVGASIGAMATLYAAAEGHISPIGIIEFGGINHASGYDFSRAQIHRIGGLKVFLSSRSDIYGGADAAREWYGWASSPKRIELLPGSEHGTDLLRRGNHLREQVERVILRGVQEAVAGNR
jgi:uncharacterized protein